jgi:hypothetical protein
VVSRDLLAFDMRSLNGTTIDGRFLQYGDHQGIAHGDLITIAGIAPFRFSTIERSYFPFFRPPAPEYSSSPDVAWAILLDGGSRRTIPLVDGLLPRQGRQRRHFACGREGRWEHAEDCAIQRSIQMELQTLDSGDDYHLFGMFKFEDRTYVAVGILRRARERIFQGRFGTADLRDRVRLKMTFASAGSQESPRGCMVWRRSIQTNPTMSRVVPGAVSNRGFTLDQRGAKCVRVLE